MIFGVARRAGRLTGNGEPFDCVASRTAHPTARYQPTLSRVRLLKTKKIHKLRKLKKKKKTKRIGSIFELNGRLACTQNCHPPKSNN
jgi:hypothetical protein